MKHRTSSVIRMICTLAVAAALTTTTGLAEKNDMGSGPKTPNEFLKEALQASQLELRAAKLAQDKGQREAVRQLGESIAKDQKQIQTRLKEIADNKNVEASEELRGEHQKQLEKLQQASSAEFDRKFITQMIADHKRDLAIIDQCSDKFSDDAQISALIRDHRSTVKRHLESAQDVARRLGFESQSTAQGSAASSDVGKKGDGEILGLPTSNKDGTILGVVPAPSSKVEAGNQSESYIAEELADGEVDEGVENVSQADDDTVAAPASTQREGAASKSIPDKE